MEIKHTITGILIGLLVVGCTSGVKQEAFDSLQMEYTKLEVEAKGLRATVEELQNTPTNLMATANEQLKSNKKTEAIATLHKLVNKYPSSTEAKEASRIIAEEEKKEREAREKEERERREAIKKEEQKKALGFKILKENSNVSYGYLDVKFTSVTSGKRWTFDSYDDRYFYRDAERDEIFIIARMSIKSSDKYPKLPPVGVYEYRGGFLHQLEVMDYKFARWQDYGSYLGNYADYGNDFSHTSTIPFSNAATIKKSDFDNSAIFVVMKKEGVFERTYDKYSNPEISYKTTSYSSMKLTLTVDDFDNDYQLIKIFNKGKL